jgi:hypothetical protein
MSGLATIAPMHNDGQRSGNSAGSQCRHGSRCYIHGEMTEAICVTAAGYADALTRGKRYMILARADDKAQIQVRTDTGLVRWFPLSCVDLSSQDVPALVRIIPRDARAEGPTGCLGYRVHPCDGNLLFVARMTTITTKAIGTHSRSMRSIPSPMRP